MKDVIFTSVAFGAVYIDQQRRLRKSILEIYPDANILFFEGRLPDTSRPFLDSLYGFKPHAIEEARKRQSKVIWFDPAMLLVDKIDRIVDFPLIAVRDDSTLADCISDKYLKHVDESRDFIRSLKWNLVGGSFLYFNFNHWESQMVFENWKADEAGGWFGSQQEQASEQINSHRNDESCLAYRMQALNLIPNTPEEVGYCTSENAITKKIHFK